MRALSRLTFENLRKNRKRSIVTTFGVALSAALIFAVIAMATSFWNTMRDYAINQYGDFHESFEYIPGDKLSIVENAFGVESVYYARDIKMNERYLYLEGCTMPLPSELYERVDTIDDAERTPENSFVVFVRYNNPKRHERFGKDIGYALEDEKISFTLRENSQLLLFDGDIDYNTVTILSCFAALFLGIIIIASIFAIRNSFNISTTERTHEFGVLSSVGATPRQIRRSVLLEASIIGICAIPFGILIGLGATLILLLITNTLLGLNEFSMAFSMPWWVPVADAVLAFVIVWLSSASAAIRAGRLTPIEAIRSNQDIKAKNKRLKTNRFIQNYFGIGGVIADKNLKRSRPKYRTTVVSIVVSVAIFVGLSSFIIDGQRIAELAYPDVGADYVISGGDVKQYKEIAEKFNLGEDYVIHRSVAARGGFSFVVLSREYFEKYARSVGVKEDFDHAVIFNSFISKTHSNGSRSRAQIMEDITDGSTLNIAMNDYKDEKEDTVIELAVTKVTDKDPMGTYENDYPSIYVSEDYYQEKKLIYADDYAMMYVNPGDRSADITAYIAEKVSHIDLNEISEDEVTKILVGFDLRESRKAVDNVILLAAIFMYGFIAVVALIGVTNIFNTITTNIQLRAKEFAMLKSVGMTDDEFNRMIRLETVLYTSRALIISLPIGIGISIATHYLLGEANIDLPYQLPLVPIFIAVVVVSVLIAFIMRYSVRQISKQNIIETIRQETV